ncbi:hypothetical protein AB0I49_21750 [Streptomyces sp. NPDC050617]|uniref:hypothetical protein n=1 Tax=Streptomyces sp. NPDC050617 TaxID=3154628 RepID=UPI00343C04A1
MLRRTATALAVATLALSGALVSTAASAAPAAKAAVDCKHSISHETPGSASGTFKKSITLKTGPYADCGKVKQFPEGSKFWIWCGAYNNYKNLWYYGRVDGTQTKGWVYGDNLVWSGTWKSC